MGGTNIPAQEFTPHRGRIAYRSHNEIDRPPSYRGRAKQTGRWEEEWRDRGDMEK
jgi:hypothetical protein